MEYEIKIVLVPTLSMIKSKQGDFQCSMDGRIENSWHFKVNGREEGLKFLGPQSSHGLKIMIKYINESL